MIDTATLHDEAMATADEGDLARRRGDHEAALAFFAQALEMERRAAEAEPTQPSRCILFRSAAWLALEAEDASEAERLAACGLADRGLPDRVKTELRAVAEEARLRLHRPLPPPTATSSISLHLEGPEVGFGGADPADVEPRVAALRSALVRTAERQAGSTFRRRGPPPQAIAEQLQPRLQYAAGSVVVQVTLGGAQAKMWDANAALVDEVRRSLEAYRVGGEEALVPLIADSVYRENFASLAMRLAPDGVRVTSVDVLSATTRGALPVVRLRKRPEGTAGTEPRGGGPRETRVLVGELRGVDETVAVNQIKLQSEDGVHRIRVRDAVMEDLVRPFYGVQVQVTVRGRAGRWELVGLPEPVGP